MGRGLVGDHVGHHAVVLEPGEHLRRVAHEGDGLGQPLGPRLLDPGHGLLQVVRGGVDLAQAQPPLHPPAVHLDEEADALVEGDGEGLRAAHLAQAGGDHELPLQGAPALLPRQRAEGLVGALQDALGADVDPTAGGHLPVHDEPFPLPAVEVLLGGPMGHDVAVGQQHAWRVGVGAEDSHRLAGLHEERLVRLQVPQRGEDGLEAVPVARRPPATAVDDEVVGVEGHLRVQVVLEHAIGGLDLPVLAGQFGAAGSTDGAGHGGVPWIVGGAISRMSETELGGAPIRCQTLAAPAAELREPECRS